MSKTIMVVDDEKRLVSLVESYLTQEGYRVVTAHNGRDALTVAHREKPDLIRYSQANSGTQPIPVGFPWHPR